MLGRAAWLSLVVTLTATSATAAAISGPIVNPANGHTYYLLGQNTWTASEAEAISLGGHLVTINDAAENAWVLSTFSLFGGSPKTLWIGLNDVTTESAFVWSSGDPSSYRNFARFGGTNNEPNNGLGQVPGGENWVQMYDINRGKFAGFWNDISNATSESGVPLHGVVELGLVTTIPLPAAVWMLGSACFGLGFMRRCSTQASRNIRK